MFPMQLWHECITTSGWVHDVDSVHMGLANHQPVSEVAVYSTDANMIGTRPNTQRMIVD